MFLCLASTLCMIGLIRPGVFDPAPQGQNSAPVILISWFWTPGTRPHTSGSAEGLSCVCSAPLLSLKLGLFSSWCLRLKPIDQASLDHHITCWFFRALVKRVNLCLCSSDAELHLCFLLVCVVSLVCFRFKSSILLNHLLHLRHSQTYKTAI